VFGRVGYRPAVPITMTSNLSGDRSQAALRKRGAALALIAAIASVTAALTFSSNLAHLVDTPRLQGWNFDVLVGNSATQMDQQARGVPLLAKNRLVGGFSSIGTTFTGLTIDGRQVDVVGIDAEKGGLYPPILEGRPPTAPDEIVLASRTLAGLHRKIGDRVRVAAGTHQTTLRIVGLMMNTSAGDVLTGRLDQGGVVMLPTLRRLAPTNTMVTLFVVRYARGADQRAAYRSLQRDFGHVVLRHVTAQDVQNVERVAALPGLLAALVVLLAVAALAHALLTGVGRGRKDLAIARACGFVRRQLATTVLWQTWWLTVCGLAVGLPLGILTGRSAWRLVARQIGTSANPFLPAAAILLVVPAVLVVASATAAVPAWMASRVTPTALRSE
jgi:putative ABC transport system permease protein